MNQDTPLQERWLGLCAKAGIPGGDQWDIIYSSYTDAQRAYHNLKHIEDCLSGFDQSLAEVKSPIAVEFAIWFHDLIYDTKGADNEERSAQAAEAFLEGLPIARSVGSLIRATNHQAGPSTGDAALICDIDLGILGSDPVRYAAYANAIRREYDWVGDREFELGRIKVLEGFLGRDTIFFSPSYRARYEKQARSNISAEIHRLRGESIVQ